MRGDEQIHNLFRPSANQVCLLCLSCIIRSRDVHEAASEGAPQGGATAGAAGATAAAQNCIKVSGPVGAWKSVLFCVRILQR